MAELSPPADRADNVEPIYPPATATTNDQNIPRLHFDDLPVELIIRILYFAVDTHGSTEKDVLFPYTALLVSKRWHDIALSAPELWTAVRTDFIENPNLSDQLSHLKRHFTRSCNRPLDVTLSMDSMSAWFLVLQSQSEDGVAWNSLDIRGPSGALLLLVLVRVAPQLDGEARCLASLETLVIKDQRNQKITGGPGDLSGGSHHLLKVLQHLTGLKSLHTRHISLRTTDPAPGETLSVSSQLRELLIEDADKEAVLMFSWVDLPALQTLGIQCRRRGSRASGWHLHTGVTFPALKTAVLYEVDPASAITILAGSPEIQTLAISHTRSSQALQSLVDPEICPKLAVLAVHGKTESLLQEVMEKRLPTMGRLVLDAAVAGEAGIESAMSWLRDRVEVEVLGAAELEFAKLGSRERLVIGFRMVISSIIMSFAGSTDSDIAIAAASCSEVPSTLATIPDTESSSNFPVDDLPVELIIRIIYFAIDTYGGTNKNVLFPYTALLVSKWWHDIALSAPELWTAVKIHFRDNSDLPIQIHCLERHFTRSRKQPLDLDITAPEYSVWSRMLRPQSEVGSTWKSMRIRDSSLAEVLLMLRRASTRLDVDARCLMSLETLVIVDQATRGKTSSISQTFNWNYTLMEILYHFNALTTLHTHHAPLTGAGLLPNETRSVTSSLKELLIEDADQEAVRMLGCAHFPALQIMAIQCRQPGSPTSEQLIQIEVNFPALMNVVLYGIDPDVTNAILSGGSEIQSLALSHTRSSQTLRRLIDPQVCPKLVTLIVNGAVESSIQDVVRKRLPMMERVVMDAVIASPGEAEMSWLRDHVVVEMLGGGELDFNNVCRRLLLS